MDARTKRTLYRLLAVFVAAGAGDALIQFVNDSTYDWRHLVAALVTAAIVAGEMYLKQSDPTTAAPSVRAVNTALETQSAVVAPPKVKIPPPVHVKTIGRPKHPTEPKPPHG
jgi:hypothetical protein